MSDKKTRDQDEVAETPFEESRVVDIGHGYSVPEVIYTYERGPDGKVLRKKRRLVKRPRKKGLSEI